MRQSGMLTVPAHVNVIFFQGLSKDKERREEDRAQNSFWVYSLKKYKWCVF